MIATPQALAAVLKHLSIPRPEWLRADVRLGVFKHDVGQFLRHDERDSYVFHLQRWREGRDGRREGIQTVEVELSARELLRCGHSAGAVVDLVKEKIKDAVALLCPRPVPPFRIGTKPRAKRLQPKPMK